MAQEAILEVKNLRKVFNAGGKSELTALADLTFSLYQGECLGIIGASGSGKSTLARLLLRLQRPSSGSIYWYGRDINEYVSAELYRQVQLLFQEPRQAFNPNLQLRDSLAECLYNRRLHPDLIDKMLDEKLALCALDASFKFAYPEQLSGGECQRANLARALLQEPQVLVCDEITSALDAVTAKKIMELLKTIRKKQQLSLIFISHNLSLVEAVCDRALVVQSGRLVESGEVAELIEAPQHPYTQSLVAAMPKRLKAMMSLHTNEGALTLRRDNPHNSACEKRTGNKSY